MFYRFFGKSNGSKGSSGVNSSTAASFNGISGSTTPAAVGGANSPSAGNDIAAAALQLGGKAGDGGGVAAAVARGGGDRRAFPGEERLLEHPHRLRRYPLDPEDDAELLVLLTQQYSITSVVITHYRVKENYVEYVIECVRGYDAWRVYRRYQQFKTLDHDLRQLSSGRHGANHGPYGVVPALPGSHWMDVTNQSPELVEQRRQFLEIYLQQLLVPKNLFYVARTALFDFLHEGEVPTHLKITGIQPLLGLISTRTDAADCDDDDEAILKEQRTYQAAEALNLQGESPSPAAEEPAATASSASSELPASPGVFPQPQPHSLAAVLSTENTVRSANTPSSPVRGAAASATGAAPSGEQENRSVEDRKARERSANRSSPTSRFDDPALSHDAAVSAVDSTSFAPPSYLHMSFTDERLPPAMANCAQCNAEFTSFLYPHRCFFCRVQYCTSCLQRVMILDGSALPASGAAAAAAAARELMRNPLQAADAAAAPDISGRIAPACRQCAENYNRRLDRCITAPGGGAYRGMQSTLAPPTHGSSSAQVSPAQSQLHGVSPAASVGAERSSMMLQKRNTALNSPAQRTLPSGSFAGRANGPSAVGFQDFQLLTVIGRGTFGKVLKVQQRATGKVYAMKIMNKATVYKRCMTSYMKEEKSILTSIKPHPYIVRCYFAFQTDYYLVFVMDYLPGGELYDYLYPRLRLTPEAACFYAAELVLALEHLHRLDVVHRDLKPENVVLTADGHLCLTDFGLARRAFSRSRRRSFVGSPEYVAPETIQGQVQTAAVDWWSFGIMLYEMLTGRTPFHARNNNTVYDNVLHKELKLPLMKPGGGVAEGELASPLSPGYAESLPDVCEEMPGFKGFTPEEASLLSGLLARDATMRLQDAATIKKHPFFRSIDWDALRRKSLRAPCIPGDLRDNDVRHFKREFVSEWASVPPLTTMTRASIDALTKCFDNFPLSRAADSPSSALSVASSTGSPSGGSSQHSGSGGAAEVRGLSRSLTLLPPSVLSADLRTLREPVHAAQTLEGAQKCFHGMWRVVSVEVHALDDGRVIFPWGGDVAGLLVYGPDGKFSLQLTPNERRPMGPVQRVNQLSKEDLCDAYCSYAASFGDYQLFPSSTDDGCGVVRHFAEGNLCPNLMLTNTVFQYRMDVEAAARSGEGRRKQHAAVASSSSDGAAGIAAVGSAKARTDRADGPPRPMRVPSTCGSESSVDGRASPESSSSLSRDAERTVAFDDTAEELVKARAEPPPPRYVLRLSTRPQRALDENFMAFTSLVFEKVG